MPATIDWNHLLGVLTVSLVACSSAPPAPAPVILDAGPAQSAPPPIAPDDPPPLEPPSAPHRLSLTDLETSVAIPGSDLSVRLMGGWHKASAPLVGVDVQFRLDDRIAEMGWRLERGVVTSDWRDLAGHRYDEKTERQLDTTIPGWQVRLVSVDASNAGGSPTAITIEVRPTPRDRCRECQDEADVG